ncbi:Arylsulfotransferase (ASST) [Halogranum amylolyticum]|uniref:Arylsulfotransferase (ASST) n=1 Tax=Halogranum amylolyticum TaxID=660520 RepID=A0A1H8SFD0_9EURY|nr:arylsulfotransferase family protein [Halogranum amylolyticum]SEO77226.1 Arylsulfotransferase (ASST) [Halogranum amylolyticum]
MSRISKRHLRIALASVIVLSVVGVGYGFAQSSSETTFESHLTGDGDVTTDDPIAPEADGITVVATDSNSWRGERSEGPRALAELVAFNPDGSVLYYNDSHTRYWDVDPVEGTQATVEYSYADHLESEECPTEWNPSDYGVDQETWDTYYDVHSEAGACTYNGVERVNLSTGESEQVWGHATPGKEATRYHDVDRLNETHLVVADIFLDGVFVVNTETDEVEWRWNATESLSTEDTGGEFPKDWSHINDVEVLDDGRIMVSPRNMDRVVFLQPNSTSLDKEWTLGEEDDYSVLYEQHNPDFINESNGGPAAIVADSENNRVLEYQRTDDGEWERTWIWRDARMQWPRDADRLPNGHTLISDSNGNRVFEVDENGEIVWDVNIAFPYEAERLGTGDESTNGPSAQSADVDSRTGNVGDQFWIAVKNFIPGKYLNGLMYITPVWMGVPEVFAVVLGALAALTWGGLEANWRLRER